MGGHTSKQTVNSVNDTIVRNVFNQTQDCMSISDGENYIGVFGDNNVVSHVFQAANLSINKQCLQKLIGDSNFTSSLANNFTQDLANKGIALTEWSDSGNSDENGIITNKITNEVDMSMVQKCMSDISGKNILNISGDGNMVKDITQQQTQKMISNCSQNSNQHMGVVNDITNKINQKAQFDSDNPLSFITDFLDGFYNDTLMFIALMFICVIIAVCIFKLMDYDGTEKN